MRLRWFGFGALTALALRAAADHLVELADLLDQAERELSGG